MFKRRTLFILGAGASAEVNLPVGTKLAKTIANMLNIPSGPPGDGPGDRVLAQLYEKHPISNNGYHRAAEAIRRGVELTTSIDDYLDRHVEDELVQRVGRAAIVRAIIDAEYASYLSYNPNQPPYRFALEKIENTWFTKFFRMLGYGVNVSNVRHIFDSVAFIVFNYDRCLEFFLITAIQSVYGVDYNDAVSIVDDCHIIHPYGFVADLPRAASGIRGIPFGGESHRGANYVDLSARIKIFTEQMAAGDVLELVHEEMFRAQQIVFLGFGYHDPNMAILAPEKKLDFKRVFGTAKDMSEFSINMVRYQLARMFTNVNDTLEAMQISDKTSGGLLDFYAKALTE